MVIIFRRLFLPAALRIYREVRRDGKTSPAGGSRFRLAFEGFDFFADAELDAHHLPERRNRNRPPKFSLPPLEGEARETFTLGLLLRKIEQLNPHASGDENEDVAEPDAEAVRRQLEALRDSVPPPRRTSPRRRLPRARN